MPVGMGLAILLLVSQEAHEPDSSSYQAGFQMGQAAARDYSGRGWFYTGCLVTGVPSAVGGVPISCLTGPVVLVAAATSEPYPRIRFKEDRPEDYRKGFRDGYANVAKRKQFKQAAMGAGIAYGVIGTVVPILLAYYRFY